MKERMAEIRGRDSDLKSGEMAEIYSKNRVRSGGWYGTILKLHQPHRPFPLISASSKYLTQEFLVKL